MFTKVCKSISVRIALALMVGIWGVIPARAIEDHSPTYAGLTWYVATTGDDANSCSSAGSPCGTINGAVAKSSTGDNIKVATGVYGGGTVIDKSLQVTGGWNNTFTVQTGFSVVDGQYTEPTLLVITMPEFGQITVEVSRFIIQHSNHEGINVSNAIFTLRDTTVRDNWNAGNGGGIYASVNNTIVLNNVTISGNHAALYGGAIYSYGFGQTNTITINNSTIANNSAGLSGAGIFIESGVVIHLQNSILADNHTAGQGADCLGTISSAQHTIIGDMTGCTITTGTGNQLNTDPLIGALPIGSPGYHALKPGSPAINAGNAATCLVTDARGVARPQGGACDIGAYEYVSPGTASAFGAITGTPQESGPRTDFPSQFAVYVVDATGNPVSGATVNFMAPSSGASGTFASSGTHTVSVLTDSIGVAVASPFTANGQQGEYNVTASVAGLPGSASFALTNAAWYVSTTGSDSNSCNISSSPCATINKAVEKASDGDTILVGAGTYTPVDEYGPTVSIDKDVTVSGGWNFTFTAQDDYSIVDGQNTRLGISVGPSTLPAHFYNAVLDHFIIQNSRGGLGVRDSDLWIKNSIIQNNSGSGIGTFWANLIITDTIILGNVAPGEYDNGGGINLSTASSLLIKNSVIADNAAHIGGGIYLDSTPSPGGNAATLINVTLSGNMAWVAGGLFGSQGYVNLNNVTVTNNIATVTQYPDTGGGGIANSGVGSNFIVENSLIAGNFAKNGSDCLGTFASRGHNLIGTSKGCTIPAALGDQIGDVNSPINPLLNELWDNGGQTLTHSLQSNSPAIDAGADDNCPSTDQRGVTRPQGNRCDIGAYELRALTVTKTDDTNDGVCDADCSLREAIEVASGGGTIQFAPSLSGQTIPLNSTLVINKDLMIDGSTLPSKVSVSGSGSVTVFEITAVTTATLNSLTITDGHATEYDGGVAGGGIKNYGTLNIINSIITNNVADSFSSGNGGGIHNAGKLNINASIISNNSAYFGGGIMNMGESLQISESILSENVAVEGGGIYNASTLDLTNSTVSNNSARGAGIISIGTVHVTNSTFVGNSSSDEGGGILSYGPLTIANSTFSSNSAATLGGAIYNGNGTLNLTSTILANSPSGTDCYNDSLLNGIVGININNLIENNSASPGSCGPAAVTGDPKLGLLSDNGGPTYTLALLPDSPAIDAGDDASCPETDQRGVTRPQGMHCDIGAYEFDGDATPPTVTSILRASANHTSAASVNFTVTFSEPVLNVDASDFTLHVTGSIDAASIGSITGSGFTRIVTVNTGTGNGTLRLDMPASASITDVTGNSLAGLPFTSGQSYTILKDATFSDVETDYWAWQYVERLVNAGITAGCGGGQYCPESSVTRAQMAIFLLRGIHGSSYNPPAVGASTGFGDVPTDHWAGAWIKQLVTEGITAGCGSGNYCPEAPVTRAQMAVFLLRSKYGSSYAPPAVGGSTGFTDVDPTHWAGAWIKQLVAEGITAGCGSGTYCPEAPVTRAQMAVFLVRAFGIP